MAFFFNCEGPSAFFKYKYKKIRVVYQKSEDKNHRSLCSGWYFGNNYSQLIFKVYMAMYSESLIKSYPITVSTLWSYFCNSLLSWNRGEDWNQYILHICQSSKSNCISGVVIQLILII